jgi:HAD superfamily hydrolase (TIGR01509 family)
MVSSSPPSDPGIPQFRGAATAVISEFMASNDTTVTDQDGGFADWLELYRPLARRLHRPRQGEKVWFVRLMIRALIFDFDGLILDTETALIDAYGDVHGSHGLPFDRPLFTRSVGHADYAFDPWNAFGLGADRELLESQRKVFNRTRNESQPILPGVVALMDEARNAGLKVGLASNSGHAHVEGHLGRLGLVTCFDFIACREDVPAPKPEPDLYRLVLNQFGIRGHEAIAFEDSRTGTLAAKRAGVWVVAVPNVSTGHHDFSHVDLRIGSLADCRLPELMARFSQ